VYLFVQGENNDTVFSTSPAILEAVHLYSPVSVRSELNISRGDYSPCTNNDTVFDVEKTVSLFVQGE
jgi:hypothetical protein